MSKRNNIVIRGDSNKMGSLLSSTKNEPISKYNPACDDCYSTGILDDGSDCNTCNRAAIRITCSNCNNVIGQSNTWSDTENIGCSYCISETAGNWSN